MVKRLCLLLAALLTALQIPVYADALYEVRTRQIYCFSDLMRAYIDIEDRNSAPVNKPERSSVIGYIDGTKLTTSSVNRFGDTGEGVADIFLVDISGSLRDDQMDKVKAAIKTWAANMKQNDRIAVMTFGSGVNTLIDFSDDKNAIDSAVDNITNNDNETQLYGGISQALKLATRNDRNLPKRRNIELITDGVNEYSGGISEEDVYSQLRGSLIPVYSLWMPGGDTETGRATVNSVTEYSGGTMYDMSDKDIDTVYGWIRDGIQNTYAVDFSYGGAAADNSAHTFKVRVAENDKVAEDTVSFTMTKTDEESGTYRIAEADSAENENADDTQADSQDADSDGEDSGEENEKNNMLLFIIIGAAIVFLGAAAAVVALIIRGRNGGDHEEPPIKYNSTDNNYAQPSAGQQYGQDPNKTISIGYDPTTKPGTAGGIKISLESESGKRFGAVLSDRITIGRSRKCDIVLNSQTISGSHAALSLMDGRVYIEDLQSVNGTLVNGMLINSLTEVKNGDSVIFGGEEYKMIL